MIPNEYILAAVTLIAVCVVLFTLRILAAVVEREHRWLVLIRQARTLRSEYSRKLAQMQERGRRGAGRAAHTAAELIAEPVDAPPGDDAFDVDIVEEPVDEPPVAKVSPADTGSPARAAA